MEQPVMSYCPGWWSLQGDRICRWSMRALLGAIVIFLIAPLISVIGTSFNTPPLIIFPPPHLSLDSFRQIPDNWYQAFFTSLKVAFAAAGISAVLTVPAAFALVRGRLPGCALLESMFRSPLLVPQIVLSVSIYQYYVVLAGMLGNSFISGFEGLVIAHTLLVSPYILSTVFGRIANLDPAYEEASIGLGASSTRTFLAVTLPILRPALTAALILAFVISFDNVTLSLFLSTDVGSSTLPVTLFSAIELSASPVIFAAAALTILVSVLVTFSVERLIGLRSVTAR